MSIFIKIIPQSLLYIFVGGCHRNSTDQLRRRNCAETDSDFEGPIAGFACVSRGRCNRKYSNDWRLLIIVVFNRKIAMREVILTAEYSRA